MHLRKTLPIAGLNIAALSDATHLVPSSYHQQASPLLLLLLLAQLLRLLPQASPLLLLLVFLLPWDPPWGLRQV